MKISIGDNNKIKNSSIGSKVEMEKRKKHPVLVGIVATVIAGIILLFIEYAFDLIGIFS